MSALNSHPFLQTLHEGFELNASRSPRAPAVCFETQCFSYGEIEARANRLAHCLRALGVGPDARVGLLLERSAAQVVAPLGVLKAGAAYVPLDLTNPPKRLAAIAERTGISALIRTRAARESSEGDNTPAVTISASGEIEGAWPTSRPDIATQGDALASVICTSGSTGEPKAVAMTHGMLVHVVQWLAAHFGLGPQRRVLQYVSSGFDVAITDIFSTLWAGACLQLMKDADRTAANRLADVIDGTGIDCVFLPPVVLEALADHVERTGRLLPTLRALLVGGETLKVTPQLRQMFARHPGCSLYNVYGPAEAHIVTVEQLGHSPLDWPRLPPIGRPRAATTLRILDENEEEVPAGSVGQICIGGRGIARGYLGDARLTAERFVPDPFSDQPGARMYRTGDLGTRDPEERFSFKGRSDGQVKLRGHRIEVSEIEASLALHSDVRASAVIAQKIDDRVERLIAFVVAAPGGHADASALRQILREHLPEVMVPSSFRFLHALPLTSTGKVDRLALQRCLADGSSPDEIADDRIADDWRNVREAWHEAIGVADPKNDDNFFDVGGHSLASARLAERLAELTGLDVPLDALVKAATPRGMVALVENLRRNNGQPTVESRNLAGDVTTGEPGWSAGNAAPAAEEAPLAPEQNRLWILEQARPGSALYNVPVSYRLRGALDSRALYDALLRIVNRHGALRTRFREKDGRPTAHASPPLTHVDQLPITFVDLQSTPAKRREESLRRLARSDATTPFELGDELPIRFTLVKIGPAEHALVLVAHHLVFDGTSIEIFASELAQNYALPPARDCEQVDSYAAYARSRQNEDLSADREYWTRQLALLEPNTFPRGGRPDAQAVESESLAFSLDEVVSRRIADAARAYGTTPAVLLQAAYIMMIGSTIGQEDCCVGMAVGIRPAQFERSIGFFVNTLPIRANLAPSRCTLGQFVQELHATHAAALAHRRLPFDEIVELFGDRVGADRPLVTATMSAAPLFPPHRTRQGIEIETMADGGYGLAKFDLTMYLFPEAAGLRIELEYRRDLARRAEVQAWSEQFKRFVDALIDEPDLALGQVMGRDAGRRGDQAPSSIVIGDGTLPIACAEALLRRNLAIVLVVTDTPEVETWCAAHGVPVTMPSRVPTWQDRVAAASADYLLSLGNERILSERVRRAGRRGAIGCHDSLLPAYAGTHVQSWALMNRERVHGVTWYVLEGKVDGGRILAQETIPIDESETAFSLMEKVFAIAAESFEAIILERMLKGDLAGVPQDERSRSFYGRRRRPNAAGIIDFEGGAEEIVALVRALHFGSHANPLCLPKFALNGAWFVCQTADIETDRATGAPGTIIRSGAGYLVVATRTDCVRLGGIVPLVEQPDGLPPFADESSLRSARVSSIDPGTRRAITELHESVAAHESFWLEQLDRYEPAEPLRIAILGQRAEAVPGHWRRPRPRQERFVVRVGTAAASPGEADRLAGEFLVFLAKLGGRARACVALEHHAVASRVTGLPPLFARRLPLIADHDPDDSLPRAASCAETALQACRKAGPFLTDLPLRRGVPTLFDRTPTSEVCIQRVQSLEAVGDEKSPPCGLSVVIPDSADEVVLAGPLSLENLADLGRRFVTFREHGRRMPDGLLRDVSLVGPEERAWFLDGPSRTRRPWSASTTSFVELFRQRVAASPTAIAVADGSNELTYGELNELSNRVAAYLARHGVGSGDVVALGAPRNAQYMAALIGIMKSGSSYLPLDVSWPESRQRDVLGATAARALLCDGGTTVEVAAGVVPPPRLVCGLKEAFSQAESKEPPIPPLSPKSLAYVIPTSGTTGAPKIVMVEHLGMLNHLLAKNEDLGLTTDDVVAQTATASFDISIWQFLSPLLVGAKVVIYDDESVLDPPSNLDRILTDGVTIFETVPSLLALALEHAAPGRFDSRGRLRTILLTGERLPVGLCRQWFEWFPTVPIINAYGPSECSDDVCHAALASSEALGPEDPPLGKPIANTAAYILGADGDLTLPGVEGEIHIAGDGVGRGYHADPRETADRFRPNPFGSTPGARLYATGDLGRMARDGSVYMTGRRDGQVKIAGVRVEPSEIARKLEQHPAIVRALVVARQGADGEKALIAYFVPKALSRVTSDELRIFLSERLPRPFVPLWFAEMKAIPLRLNGKVDEGALPDPRARRISDPGPPPVGAEDAIAAIWREELGVARVGRDDSFFSLGGHSLSLMKLRAKLELKFGKKLKALDMFRHTTPRQLAALLTQPAALVDTEGDVGPIHLSRRARDALTDQRNSRAKAR